MKTRSQARLAMLSALAMTAVLLVGAPVGAQTSDEPAATSTTVPLAGDPPTTTVPTTTSAPTTTSTPPTVITNEPHAATTPVDEGEIVHVNEPVPGEYIVTLADQAPSQVRATASDLAADYDGEVLSTYRHAIQAFAVEMTEADALALSKDPAVAAVEENAVVRAAATQPGATFGLDRVDQRNLPLSTTYTYNATGAGVDVYILDTGVRTTHQDFGGRASYGFDFVDSDANADDCNGHGTHVAGTVGGSTFGVAKAATLIAVRVLNCLGTGTTVELLSGINYVTANRSGPTVANISLGFDGFIPSLETAVNNSIAAGVTYVVAAGNANADACGTTPASTSGALTVGATTNTDARLSTSNLGSCVDIFAPGSGITSDWFSNDGATNTISGTSTASAHVAGAAALYLQTSPAATPAQVAARLIDDATPNKVTDPGAGSPNRLLFTGDLRVGATLAIVQDSIADSDQDFAYSVTCTGGPCGTFSLDDDTNAGLPRQVRGLEVPNGTYTITQAAVPNWTLTSIVCDTGETVQLGSRRVVVTVTTNEQITCTFTDRSASITLIQDSVPNSAQDFMFTGCSGAGCGAPFPLDDDPSSATPGSGTGAGLVPGNYTVTQAAVSFWPLTELTCTGGIAIMNPGARSATISVGPTDHVTCTWRNTSATITLIQDTVPDNAQDFLYTGCSGGCGVPFPLDDDPASATPKSGTGDGLAPGTYTITQSATAGWDLFQLSCNTGETVSLASRQVTIVLTPGEQVVCTFSNRLSPPPNDNFANAQVVTGWQGTVSGTTVAATREPGEPSLSSGPTVWYRWDAPGSSNIMIHTCFPGTNFDTTLGVYVGSQVNALTPIATNDDATDCANRQSKVIFNGGSTTFWIAIGGYNGASGNFSLSYELL